MSLLTRNKAPKVAEQNAGRKLFGSRGATISVWIIAVLWTIPTLGLFATSLRPKAAISETGWWQIFLHPHFTLSNYTAIFSTGTVSGISNGILPYFINSFVITIPAVVFPIALATMAAYCLAWVKFKGSDAIFYGIFALQIVPIQVTLVPLLLLFGNRISSGIHIGSVQVFPGLHIAGKFLGIWVPHTMFALPLAIYLLHHFMVFRKIVLPLSIPAIAAFSIFQFLWVWNDLLVALTFTGGTEGINPLNAKLAGLAGTWGSHWELLTSSAFITILVPLVVFFSLQRYFVRGLLAGSVK
jgi:alpha-glucoside transport system permease protein